MKESKRNIIMFQRQKKGQENSSKKESKDWILHILPLFQRKANLWLHPQDDF